MGESNPMPPIRISDHIDDGVTKTILLQYRLVTSEGLNVDRRLTQF